MLKNIKFKYLLTTVFSLALINNLDLQLPTNPQANWLVLETEAHAKKSGARSGGGSFTKRSSPSPSGSRSSNSRSNSSPSSSGSRSSSSGSRSNSSPRSNQTPTPPSRLRSTPKSTPRPAPIYRPSTPVPAPVYRPSTPVPAPVYRPSTPVPAPVYRPSTPVPAPVYRPSTGSSESRTYYPANSGSSAVGVTSNSSSVDTNNFSWFNTIILLLVLGLVGIPIFILLFGLFSKLLSASNRNGVAVSSGEKERDNDTVTISKLQVALLSTATEVQEELSQLSTNIDTSTDAGLWELLQESLLVLQRNSEHWSYVLSSGEAVNINAAETAFSKLCFQERSKFSGETLSNVEGQVRSKAFATADRADPGSYIVVTLLLGTADDRPLFGSIRSIDELKKALEKLSSMRSDYLMTFYLFWTPQQSGEGLSDDEMLMEYPELYRII
jgi:uncharacterized membrane protein